MVTNLPKGFYFRDSELPKSIQSKMTGKGFEYFDAEHTYLYDGQRMSGVTTILNSTIAKPQLIGWASRMCAEYIETEFTKWTEDKTAVFDIKAVCEAGKNAHTKKKEAGGAAGKDTHALAEEYIKLCIAAGGKPQIVPLDEKMQHLRDWAIKENITFIASEEKLYSKQMFVAGTADFIFEKEGKRYIGDIKTYKKLWDRVPMLQCAGYGLMWREMNGKDIDGYCVFNLPKEREFNEVEDVKWSYDVAGDQEGFMAALSLYRILANW